MLHRNHHVRIGSCMDGARAAREKNPARLIFIGLLLV
jgi:hypothetical protein